MPGCESILEVMASWLVSLYFVYEVKETECLLHGGFLGMKGL
jgi:hypothetical protein